MWRRVNREAISEAVEVIQRKEEYVWDRNQKKGGRKWSESGYILKAGQHDLLKRKMKCSLFSHVDLDGAFQLAD